MNRTRANDSRRTFLRNVLASLGIAVPALRMLASGSAASASEASPNIDPCAKVYEQYQGHGCTTSTWGTCPAGALDGDCVGLYYLRSTYTGEVCGEFTDTECTYCCGPLVD